MREITPIVTIGELIDLLSKYPRDLSVMVEGYEGGYDYIDSFEQLTLIESPEDYCGDYVIVFDDEDEPSKPRIPALILRR